MAYSGDIKPISSTDSLEIARIKKEDLRKTFPIKLVAPLTGFAPSFIGRVIGKKSDISLVEVIKLLELDNFSETFIPRSRIPKFLLNYSSQVSNDDLVNIPEDYSLLVGSVPEILKRFPSNFVQCVVTSTPYWGLRTYVGNETVNWADGETCIFGHESTPEGFIRHSVEILFNLKRIVKDDGSVWWNIMDSYNTRTQIRSNAVEILKAMQGNDPRGWKEYDMRRYSAGHAFLKDGEQSLIPLRIAERASRVGYWVKSVITWKKMGSMPETVSTRVTRELEYILHLTLSRAPYFDKDAYLRLDKGLGGRNNGYESEKVTDVWALSTSSGLNGHGAQFPLSLPGRCIALSTKDDDIVLDPFVGVGTTVAAAVSLNRKAIGIDISKEYIDTANELIQPAILRHSNLKLV